MNNRLSLLLVLFCFNTTWADFSDARFLVHPAQPGGDPYLIELTGEWPTDCHPGEQKPVIREYTGYTATVEFETIVEHVTCNDVSTPYRVLIDMSDVIGDVAGTFRGTLQKVSWHIVLHQPAMGRCVVTNSISRRVFHDSRNLPLWHHLDHIAAGTCGGY